MPRFTEFDYEPEPNTGCWLWLGSMDRDGYGKRGGRFAHRVVYERLVERIPDGMVIDHRCRLRCCVNPDHLRVVTPIFNTLIGDSFSAKNARKTHCPQGHPYDSANTYVIFGNGRRHRCCRICNAATQQRRRWAKRKLALEG